MNIRHTQVWEKFLRLAKARRRRALLSVSALWIVPLLVLNGGNGLSLDPLPVKAQQAATGVPASPTEQFPPGPSASVDGAAPAADPVEAPPGAPPPDVAPPAAAAQPDMVKPDALAWPSLDEALTTTGAMPPPGIDRGKTISSAAIVQLSVPPYVWYHGCGPTSAAMVFAFWDGRGFEKLLPGDPTTQSDAVNQAIASDDHYNDYALPLDDLEHSATLLEDKSEDPLGDEHADNSIADFMKTSQSVHELRYGWSSSRFMADAYTNYVKSVAPEYATNVRFLTMEDGFSWEMYKGEIDGNRPVMLVVDTDGDGETDHAGVGIGYDDASGQMMAVYDTWDTEIHWYEFAKMDIGRQWGVYGGVLYDMGVFFQVNAPQDEPDKNPGDGICLTLSNTCTLRAAIMEANATSGHDVILLPQSTYTLTRTGQNENAASTGDLDITESVTIRGEGKDITVIDGSLLDTVFAVGDLVTAASAGVESVPLSTHALAGSFFVEFSGVTIRNGVGGIKTWGSGYLDLIESAVLENQGTGVWSSGTEVTIAQSVVSNNANPGNTGGIDVSGARLNVHASTIYGNSGAVGGLSTDHGLLITESTIADNTGSAGPGGLAAAGGGTLVNSTVAQNSGSEGGGVAADDELVFINTTLSENSSSGPGGGVLAKTANQVIFSNTLITGNSGAGSPDCSGAFLSNGYNLIGNGSGCTLSAGPGDQIGANANLGSLAANGGGTLTYALLPGSAAIDSGNPLGCTDENADPLLHDQRFSLRPRDGSGRGTAVCDIGSFEVQETPLTPYPTSTPLTAVPSVTPSVSPTTPVVTVTPSVTATITPTPTASSTPIGPSCYEAIVNGGFEKDEAWVLPVTKYQAGYDTVLAQEAVANYTTDEAHSGGRSMRTGIVDPAKNTYSYSSAWQQVSIPANATSAKLTFWMLPKSINGIDGYDVQLMLILDAGKREIERPVNVRLDTGSWTSYEFDLKKYAGKTFWVYFGTYNNGYTATMSMYTDDVSLWVCKP